MATQHPPAPEQQLSPVQFSRLAHRGILLGLSISQLIVLGIGVVIGWLFVSWLGYRRTRKKTR